MLSAFAKASEHGRVGRGPSSSRMDFFLLQFAGDSLRSRIARGAFWSVVGTGISQAFGLLGTVICARLLGAAAYGQLGIVLTTVNLFATLASVGLGVTATKHVAEYRWSKPQHAGRIIAMSSTVSVVAGSLVAVLMVVMAPWLSRSTLKAPLAAELQLGALMMLFAAVNGYQTGTLAGFEAFKVQAVLNSIRGLFGFPAIVIGVHFGGLRGAVVAYTVTGALTCLVHEFAIRRECRLHSVPLSYTFRRADFRLLWSFSLPVLVASFSFTPAVWWSSAMLGTTSGYTQLGIFNAAFQWQMLVMFFSNSVCNLGLSTLSAVVPERSIAKYKQMLKVNFLLTTALAAAIAVPVGLAAPWIMSLYGHGFASGASTLRLVCGTVISAANMSVGHAIWSLRRPANDHPDRQVHRVVATAHALAPPHSALGQPGRHHDCGREPGSSASARRCAAGIPRPCPRGTPWTAGIAKADVDQDPNSTP